MSISIDLLSIQIVGTWKYKCKNTECVCNRALYLPTSDEIDKKNIVSNNIIIGECGHGMHQQCIEAYTKTYNGMCPIDRLEWIPQKNNTAKYHIVE